MKGRIKDMGFGLTGELSVTLALPREHAQEVQGLLDKDLSVEMKRWRNKRSKDANSLLWALCRDIAQAMETPHTDKEIYRRAVRDVGVFTPVPIKAEAVDEMQARWSKQGIAWFVDVEDDSKLWQRLRGCPGRIRMYEREWEDMWDLLDREETPAFSIDNDNAAEWAVEKILDQQAERDRLLKGYKRVRLYYGSSTYTTEEMSRLLDYLVDEAQQIGITLRASKKEIEEAKRRWGE